MSELEELKARVAKLEKLVGVQAEPAKAPFVPKPHQRINPLDRVAMSAETLAEFAQAVPGDLRGAAEARALGNVHQRRGMLPGNVGSGGGTPFSEREVGPAEMPLRKHGDSYADAIVDRALPAQGG